MRKWMDSSDMHGLGCGSHSCKYVKPTGMGTNSGCRCAQNRPHDVERFLLRNYLKALDKIQKLQLDLEVEKVLKDETISSDGQ